MVLVVVLVVVVVNVAAMGGCCCCCCCYCCHSRRASHVTYLVAFCKLQYAKVRTSWSKRHDVDVDRIFGNIETLRNVSKSFAAKLERLLVLGEEGKGTSSAAGAGGDGSAAFQPESTKAKRRSRVKGDDDRGGEHANESDSEADDDDDDGGDDKGGGGGGGESGEARGDRLSACEEIDLDSLISAVTELQNALLTPEMQYRLGHVAGLSCTHPLECQVRARPNKQNSMQCLFKGILHFRSFRSQMSV
jgi:hypothetical protein